MWLEAIFQMDVNFDFDLELRCGNFGKIED